MLNGRCFEVARSITRERRSHCGEACLAVLQQVLSILSGQTFLLIDALDECRDVEDDTLKAWLDEIRSLPNLRIVISSRSIQRTKELCDDPLFINLQLSDTVEKSNEDIAKYIRGRIERKNCTIPQNSSRLQEELKARSSVIPFPTIFVET